MGTPMTLPDVRADRRSAPVTPLLAFLAGGHAEVMSRIWPAPHADFLALPSARRHASAVLAGRPGVSAVHLQWMVMRARDGDIAEELFGANPPGGLMKAMSRMGEVLWAAEDYARFLDLFADESARRLIRHTKSLDPRSLAVVASLPAALRQASVVSHLGTDETALADLVSAWAIAQRVRGERAAPDIAQRFGRAGSRAALFGMAHEVIQPLEFGPVLPVPALPAGFQPVRRYELLAKTALDFRNCLRDFVGEIASGRMAVYVWRGDGGPAAVALRQDPAGWRLAEARGRDNADLPAPALMEIVSAVRAAGIRTGESWCWLLRRLEDRSLDQSEALAPPPAQETWRASLALGNLWD